MALAAKLFVILEFVLLASSTSHHTVAPVILLQHNTSLLVFFSLSPAKRLRRYRLCSFTYLLKGDQETPLKLNFKTSWACLRIDILWCDDVTHAWSKVDRITYRAFHTSSRIIDVFGMYLMTSSLREKKSSLFSCCNKEYLSNAL